MTKREMYEALVNLANGGELAVEVDGAMVAVSAEELKAFAENEIALLDRKAVKAKERAAAKKADGDALMDAVREALSAEFEPIAEIAARIEGEDVSAAKVTYRLTQLVKAGEAEKQEINVAKEGKKRMVQGYRKARVNEA